jgi:hypothetical protein
LASLGRNVNIARVAVIDFRTSSLTSGRIWLKLRVPAGLSPVFQRESENAAAVVQRQIWRLAASRDFFSCSLRGLFAHVRKRLI